MLPPLRVVLRLLFLLLAVYGGLCLVLFLAQDRLLFPAAGLGRGKPIPALTNVRTDWLDLREGLRVRLAVATSTPARAWMVFFGGNGEDLRSGVHWASAWREYGMNVVVPEYPGYGDSDGSPTEAALLDMARAAASWARARAARDGLPLIAAGASLGSFPAVQIAADGLADRLLLIAPFTSVCDVASARFWYMPVRWLLRHPMDNIARAGAVKVPVFVLHGDVDEIIARRFGEALATALHARFVCAPGCGHNDLPLDVHGPFGADVRAFLHGE